jgi:hypothetical protein
MTIISGIPNPNIGSSCHGKTNELMFAFNQAAGLFAVTTFRAQFIQQLAEFLN